MSKLRTSSEIGKKAAIYRELPWLVDLTRKWQKNRPALNPNPTPANLAPLFRGELAELREVYPGADVSPSSRLKLRQAQEEMADTAFVLGSMAAVAQIEFPWQTLVHSANGQATHSNIIDEMHQVAGDISETDKPARQQKSLEQLGLLVISTLLHSRPFQPPLQLVERHALEKNNNNYQEDLLNPQNPIYVNQLGRPLNEDEVAMLSRHYKKTQCQLREALLRVNPEIEFTGVPKQYYVQYQPFFGGFFPNSERTLAAFAKQLRKDFPENPVQ